MASIYLSCLIMLPLLYPKMLPDCMPIRQLFLPPKGRPHWLPSQASGFELLYLSWGYRWYGNAPIEPSLHEGWHYFVVLEGSPTLYVGARKLRTKPGLVCIAHPDCPVGHHDLPKRRCRILTWIWRTPPRHSALEPKAGRFLSLTLEREQLRRLETLHAECHKAAAVASERSMLQLQATRIHLDLCLLEAREHRHTADYDFRFNLAVEYLRNHLNELEPVKRLCEYLQISEDALKRLFHERAGKSPRAFALQWRMHWAHKKLSQDQAPVKTVAYALGYQYPNDFSRAFKRFFKFEASRLLGRSANTAASQTAFCSDPIQVSSDKHAVDSAETGSAGLSARELASSNTA
jgi:AraC-like DNA-binding protein